MAVFREKAVLVLSRIVIQLKEKGQVQELITELRD